MDAPASELAPGALASRRRLTDRIGDTALHAVTAAAAFGSVVILGLITYRLIYGAWPAIQAFGLGFLWHQDWNPVTNDFGALAFLYGTAVTSFAAVLIAAPLAIAIALKQLGMEPVMQLTCRDRNRLALELHDAVSQKLTELSVGKATSRTPSCNGTAKFISPMTSGIATKKIMMVPCAEKTWS
jgi:signal transduction histidine kinase